MFKFKKKQVEEYKESEARLMINEGCANSKCSGNNIGCTSNNSNSGCGC